MRHATQEDLDQIEPLLVALRKNPELRERKRGLFSLGARAFLHFHADDSGTIYVDVRFDSEFERIRVNGTEEQADLLVRVNNALASRRPEQRGDRHGNHRYGDRPDSTPTQDRLGVAVSDVRPHRGLMQLG